MVSTDEQERFAALSGDGNPMHMDPVAARRTQAGDCVVHGVHSLLWALETAAASGRLTAPPTRIKARFLKWVYVGVKAALSIESSTGDVERMQVEVEGVPVLKVDVSYAPAPRTSQPASLSPAAPLHVPIDQTFQSLAGLTGTAFTATSSDAASAFPRLCRLIGPRAVAEIAACSYIVGMEAPGLHSMFSKLDLVLSPAPETEPRAGLDYTVSYLDERFRKGRLTVTGSAIEGTLEVFVRHPPVQQQSVAALAELVTQGEFAGMHALVIGGSRGLGELTAKLVAAGGGRVTITYVAGRADADSVVEGIRSAAGQADAITYDVRLPPEPQLTAVTEPVTHLFYFATNTIFRQKSELVSAPMLATFATFYLQGFHDLCAALLRDRAGSNGKLYVYYPSTVFVEDRPAGMTEYAMMKAAGEVMCNDMNAHMPGIHILHTRLPKLRTDQTAGVLPEREGDPVSALLPVIRQMVRMAADENLSSPQTP